MDIQANKLTVQQKIEQRRDFRNLDNFLAFQFGNDKKLALVQEKVHGHAVKSLKSIDTKEIHWKSYPRLWWNNSVSLKTICHFITQNASHWKTLLVEDPVKFIAFEKQCALLERLAIKYHLKKAVGKRSKEPVFFVNPFKKTLRVDVNYPDVSGQKERITQIHEIFYDRANTDSDIEEKVKSITERPVTMQMSGSLSLNSKESFNCVFSVIPKDLFRKVVQLPAEFFNPSKENLEEGEKLISVSYDEPDSAVLAGMIYQAGKNQVSSGYEQGFTAGSQYGFAQAMQKIHSVLAGK